MYTPIYTHDYTHAYRFCGFFFALCKPQAVLALLGISAQSTTSSLYVLLQKSSHNDFQVSLSGTILYYMWSLSLKNSSKSYSHALHGLATPRRLFEGVHQYDDCVQRPSAMLAIWRPHLHLLWLCARIHFSIPASSHLYSTASVAAFM